MNQVSHNRLGGDDVGVFIDVKILCFFVSGFKHMGPVDASKASSCDTILLQILDIRQRINKKGNITIANKRFQITEERSLQKFCRRKFSAMDDLMKNFVEFDFEMIDAEMKQSGLNYLVHYAMSPSLINNGLNAEKKIVEESIQKMQLVLMNTLINSCCLTILFS